MGEHRQNYDTLKFGGPLCSSPLVSFLVGTKHRHTTKEQSPSTIQRTIGTFLSSQETHCIWEISNLDSFSINLTTTTASMSLYLTGSSF